MANRDKIDILVMRGAGRVARYRLAAGWLRALLLTPLCLALLLAAALVVIKRQRDDAASLAKHYETLQAERDSVGERLVRLENIEKILRSRDSTELETLLASANPDNPGWWKLRSEERKDAPDPKERETSRPDLTKLLSRVDANQAGVDNLWAKIDSRKLQLGFGLSNLAPQTSLTGRGEVALVGNDGGISPLKPEKDELSFQIQRFKQIAVNLALPAKTDPKDVYGLKLTVLDPAGKIIFSQVYPLTKE